jgi:lysyl endopeptidase
MFATAPIQGNEIVFEYFSPSWVQEFPRIRITKVVHGYKHLFTPKKSSSGSCNIDVACKDGADWHNQARSVAVILTDNNQKYCTGAMVNNLRQDGKQYFLTVSSKTDKPTMHCPLTVSLFIRQTIVLDGTI